MKIFKVGFKSSVCYSVNMIWANTGKGEKEAVEETAARRAARYGYEVAFVNEITEAEAQSNINKGMPYYGIDEQAERDHDPSFTEEVTEDEAEQEPTAAELPALRFERRGCEFFAGDKDNEESDIGNYRITTPGEIVPLKDGRMMLFEFGCYDRQIWRYHNKRTGEKLKKPVLDSVFTCAMHIDTEYSKPEKTGDYEWRSSWRDLNMEREFYKTPRKYTEKNILDYVNSVSAVQYGRIEYV